MIFDQLDSICSPLPHDDMSTTRQTQQARRSLIHSSTSKPQQLFNPFGPVIGTILVVYTCQYKNNTYQIYISSKAILIRRSILFVELDKEILVWDDIASITLQQNGIKISTREGMTYELHMEECIKVHEELHQVWKNPNSSLDESNHQKEKVVNEFFARVSFGDLDGDTQASEELTELSQEQISLVDSFEDVSDEELNRIWTEFQLTRSENDKFTEVVVEKLELQTTLEEFYKQFLANDATSSLVQHHTDTGDLDTTATDWKPTSSYTFERTIQYDHPINIPVKIAPPSGAATKTQLYKRFPHAIIVETETWINDVPLADCFYVADRYIIEKSGDEHVLLTIEFGNMFVKRTFFESIIKSTSVRDVTEFHKGYVDMIQSTLVKGSENCNDTTPVVQEVHVQRQTVSKSVDTKDAVQTRRSIDLQTVLLLLLLILSYASQYAMWKELKHVNSNLSQLEKMLKSLEVGEL